MRTSFLLLLLLLALASPALPQRLVSPEVSSDRRATFRMRAAGAREVLLRLEGLPPTTMQKDESGIWSFTTSPLEPGIYVYTFLVDGLAITDPSNANLKYNLLNLESQVHVPGPPTLPWEIGDVPRGVVHRHFYRSAVVGDERDFLVYTPPGYDAAARTPYPTLYLLHGYSDDATAWTSVGRAHVILDNLIARGQARPMLIVMPLGYGNREIIANGWEGIRNPDVRRRSYDKFRESLLKEVIPHVEATYHVSRQQDGRAIAGLSMGGAESLLVGLNALDTFAWIGAFSSGGLGDNYAEQFPGLGAGANARLRLLWIACGQQDMLLGGNQRLVDWLRSQGVALTWSETPGAHTFSLWRRYLAELAPLLFQDRRATR